MSVHCMNVISITPPFPPTFPDPPTSKSQIHILFYNYYCEIYIYILSLSSPIGISYLNIGLGMVTWTKTTYQGANPWRKLTFSSLCPWLPAVLQLGMKPCEPFPNQCQLVNCVVCGGPVKTTLLPSLSRPLSCVLSTLVYQQVHIVTASLYPPPSDALQPLAPLNHPSCVQNKVQLWDKNVSFYIYPFSILQAENCPQTFHITLTSAKGLSPGSKLLRQPHMCENEATWFPHVPSELLENQRKWVNTERIVRERDQMNRWGNTCS